MTILDTIEKICIDTEQNYTYRMVGKHYVYCEDHIPDIFRYDTMRENGQFNIEQRYRMNLNLTIH